MLSYWQLPYIFLIIFDNFIPGVPIIIMDSRSKWSSSQKLLINPKCLFIFLLLIRYITNTVLYNKCINHLKRGYGQIPKT